MLFEHKLKFGVPIKSDKRIKDVEPITGATSNSVTKEEIPKIVEEPCCQVCLDLFDKNIRTLDSGCNKLFSNTAYVIISYDGLDLKNKLVAQKLIRDNKAKLLKIQDVGAHWGEDALRIEVACSPEDLVFDVSQKLRGAFAEFKKQKLIEFNPQKRNEWLREMGAIQSFPNPDFGGVRR